MFLILLVHFTFPVEIDTLQYSRVKSTSISVRDLFLFAFKIPNNGIVVVTPVDVEVWMSSWWNDWGHVGSGYGSRAPVDCTRSRPSHRRERMPRLGGPMAHRLARGFYVFLGRGGSKLRGSGALMTSRGLGRGEKIPPEAPISPETFPQGSGGMEFVVHASSD
jgi:hypothetical protein